MSVSAVVAAPSAPVAPAAVPEVTIAIMAVAGSALLESFKQDEDQDQEEEKEEESPKASEKKWRANGNPSKSKRTSIPKAAEEDSGSEAEDNPYGVTRRMRTPSRMYMGIHLRVHMRTPLRKWTNDRHVHAQARGSDGSNYSTPRSVASSLKSRGNREYEVAL
ncbi:hypothetical protein EW146_g2127 [Bondarzewia mesenterica]|uniref:Uncharacterized protein n=1 Tax=Bondarzewia mesenterica TaxID=1095465 RepID=A0A4S4M3W8_9AGAM|nr:hypothetical protein EW146_g2127 [Bondarzewia mesenterica]